MPFDDIGSKAHFIKGHQHHRAEGVNTRAAMIADALGPKTHLFTVFYSPVLGKSSKIDDSRSACAKTRNAECRWTKV
jgi:hypothetical protein